MREIIEMSAISNIRVAMENTKLDHKTIVSDFKVTISYWE